MLNEQDYYDLMADYTQSQRTEDDLKNFLFTIMVLFARDKNAEDKKKIAKVLDLLIN